MKKTLLALALMSTPAFADATYRVEFAMQSQRYTVLVVDNNCGEITTKTAAQERAFRVCVSPKPQNRVQLDIDRRTRDQADEVHAKATVIAAPGASFDLDGLKVTLQVQ